jgi:hypothetical protein
MTAESTDAAAFDRHLPEALHRGLCWLVTDYQDDLASKEPDHPDTEHLSQLASHTEQTLPELLNGAISRIAYWSDFARMKPSNMEDFRNGLRVLLGIGTDQPLERSSYRFFAASKYMGHGENAASFRRSQRRDRNGRLRLTWEISLDAVVEQLTAIAESADFSWPPASTSQEPQAATDANLPPRTLVDVLITEERQSDQPRDQNGKGSPSRVSAEESSQDAPRATELPSARQLGEPANETWSIPLLSSFGPGETILDFSLGGWVVTLNGQAGPSLDTQFGPTDARSLEAARYISGSANIRNYQPPTTHSVSGTVHKRAASRKAVPLPDILAQRLALAAWISNASELGDRPSSRGQRVELDVGVSPSRLTPPLEVTASVAKGSNLTDMPEEHAWHQVLRVPPHTVIVWRIQVLNTSQETLRHIQMGSFVPRDAAPLPGRSTCLVYAPESPRPRIYLEADGRSSKSRRPNLPSTLPPGHRIVMSYTALAGYPLANRNRIRLVARPSRNSCAVSDGRARRWCGRRGGRFRSRRPRVGGGGVW